MNRQLPLTTTVFYSYAQEDAELRDQLEKHLSLLEHEMALRHWHNQRIPAGAERALVIRQAQKEATLILLLISAHFLASHQCYEIEMIYALRRHKRGKARVIPIILRPCDWQTAPFAGLECLPRSGKAVTEWDDLDAAFLNVTMDIRYALNAAL